MNRDELSREPVVEEDQTIFYRSYLLRCWANTRDQAGRPVLRFSLENAASQGRRGFPTLEALVAYIVSQIQSEESNS